MARKASNRRKPAPPAPQLGAQLGAQLDAPQVDAGAAQAPPLRHNAAHVFASLLRVTSRQGGDNGQAQG